MAAFCTLLRIWFSIRKTRNLTTLGTRCCAWPRRPETGGRTDPSKEKRGGVYDVAKRETSKLKAANSIAKKYPNWRELVWARLVHLKSPWLDHTAIAALTGARPEELRTAKVRKTASGIEIGITGAKVSDEKGQPWRLFEIGNDGSLEYAHLEANVGAAWKDVYLPPWRYGLP